MEEVEKYKKLINQKIEEEFGNGLDIQLEFNKDNGQKKKTKLKISGPIPEKLQELTDYYDKQPNHSNHLYQNSFICLISSVEWFFSQILHFFYNPIS